jgi:hypothetical protein
MPKRLIINSDDYGRSPDISRGIREAHLQGVVTSTTCMMNIPTTARDIALALAEVPNLKMGVHLVLTAKKPILPQEWVSSITDEQGDFLKYNAFIAHLPEIKISEVQAEWRAQIESFIAAAGTNPTHLDSHHHSSYFTADLFRTMLDLAKEYDCPIRRNTSAVVTETDKQVAELMAKSSVRQPDHFIDDFYDKGATQESLHNIINNLDDGTSELMCHPGYVDQTFAEKESIYNFQRERELKILTDPALKKVIQANEIELISFADL